MIPLPTSVMSFAPCNVFCYKSMHTHCSPGSAISASNVLIRKITATIKQLKKYIHFFHLEYLILANCAEIRGLTTNYTSDYIL